MYAIITIVSYIMPIFKFYKEVIFISGYKSEILQNYLKNIPNLIFIENLNFSYLQIWLKVYSCVINTLKMMLLFVIQIII